MDPTFSTNTFGSQDHTLGDPSHFLSCDEALKLADSLSIIQAGCCVVGMPPSYLKYESAGLGYSWPNTAFSRQLPMDQVRTVITALCNAITTGKLSAENIAIPSPEEAGTNQLRSTDYDLWETLIDVEELKRWLLSRNCKPPFFFGDESTNVPTHMDKNHPNFSKQLNAAVQAWEAIQDDELRKGKSVKATAIAWLENNFRTLDLVHQGKRNNNAIERIAALINWETGGGAPKTPD